MKKIGMLKWLAMAVMFFMTLPQLRAASISIPDFEINPGGYFTTSVSIDPAADQMFDYKGLQLDLTLPEGITVDVSKTALLAPLSGFKLVQEDYGNGKYRVMVYSDSKSVSYTSGLLSLTFQAAATATPGQKRILIDKVFLSSPTGTEIDLDDSSTIVTVVKPDQPGIYLYIPDFEVKQGETYQAQVSIHHGENEEMFGYKGFQFNITVPDYIRIDVDRTTLSAALNGFNLKTVDYGNGKYGFMVYGSSQTLTLTENLMSVVFIANADAPAGQAIAELQDQLFSSPTGGEIDVMSSTTIITILENEIIPVDRLIPIPGQGSVAGDPDKTPGENTENGAALINSNLIIRVGQTGEITIVTLPQVDYDPNLQWVLATNGGQYVNMTVNGANTLTATFTGLMVGDTEYTVYVAADPSVRVTGKIKVIAENPILALDVTPDVMQMGLYDGPKPLTAELIPTQPTIPQLLWTTSDPNVATVDQNGVVTPVGEGTCMITATTQDGTDLSDTSVIIVVPRTEINALDPTPGQGTTEGDPTLTPGENTTEGAALIGNDLIIRVGQTANINILTIPEVDYDPNLKWTLAIGGDQYVDMTVNELNSLIATFTGKAIGETSYTIRIGDGTIDMVTGKIYVIAENPVLSLRLDPEAVVLSITDAPFHLTPVFTPENPTVPTLVWTSSDPNVATVDENGNVTPVGVGSCTITATTTDGTNLSATSGVVVVDRTEINALDPTPGQGTTEGDPEKTPGENTMNGASLIGNDLIIRVGQTADINIVTIPVVDYDPELNWTLALGGNQYVSMTVNPDNTLISTFTGLQIGETTYSITVGDQNIEMVTGKITVIAENPVLSLRLEPEAVVLSITDAPFPLTPVFTPENPTVPTLVWTSSDPNVATVDENGNVTPVGLGSCTITATTTDGTNLSATSGVVVVDRTEINALDPTPGQGTTEGDPEKTPGENTMDGASLIGNDLIIRVGQTADINIVTIPVVNYDPELNWTLALGGNQYVSMTVNPDNTLIATFTGLQIGETTYSITVGDQDIEMVTGKITVIAQNPALSLEVFPAELELAENGSSFQLEAIIEPSDATITDVEWTTSDPSVATVDQNGNVTPVGEGECIITARTKDGTNLTATSHVTVKKYLSQIYIPDFTVMRGESSTQPVSVLHDGMDMFNYKGFDFYLKVPEHITVTAATMSSALAGFSLTYNKEGDVYHFLAMRTMGSYNADMLMNITFAADGTAVAGTFPMDIYDVVFSSVTGQDIDLADSQTMVTVTVPQTPVEDLLPTPGQGTTEGDPDKTPGENTVNGAALIGHDLIIRVGQTADINIVTSPQVDYDPNLQWSLAAGGNAYAYLDVDSSNTLVATVVGVQIGETSYTAYVKDDPTVTVTGKIKVIAANPILSLIVTPKELEMTVKSEPYQLTATIEPENPTIPQLEWTSSDESVATVDQNGVVTPTGLGTCTITATTMDGTDLSDYSTIRVVPFTEIEGLQPEPGDGATEGDADKTPGENTQNGAALIGNDLIIRVGQTANIDIALIPPVEYDTQVTWSLGSMDTPLVFMFVDPANTLTATFTGLQIGETTYTVYLDEDPFVRTTGKIKVIAANPALSIEVSPSEVELTEGGDSVQLEAIIQPEEAANQDIIWTTSDPNVATVDENGVVTPVGEGECIITATTTDGTDLSAECVVTVVKKGNDNPYDPSTIKVTTSDRYFLVESGTTVDMWAKGEGGNPDGWTYEWTLQGTENILSATGDLSILAVNENNEPLTQIYDVVVTNAWQDEVMFKETIPFTVEIWRKAELNDGEDGDGWYGNANGTWVSAIKIREGNELGMRVNEPFGGYNNEWDYLWTDPDGEEIGDEREIWTTAELKKEVTESAGDGQAISNNIYDVTVTNFGPQDTPWLQKTLQTANVMVYKRPQAPTQLLRKGDGTSFSFIVMMTPLGNQQILDLGYSYVYGYTDSNGQMHEIKHTELRYAYTTDEIYNNPDNTFWAYSLWTYPDGSIVSSGLRYLDGSEDYDFDASSFDGSRHEIAPSETIVGIYTLEGRYVGTDFNRLEPGIYIIRNTNSSQKVIKY